MNDAPVPTDQAHRIKVERKRLGKTQDQIAALCGASREMWGRYERGAFPMPGSVFRAFVAEGANADFLRTGTHAQALTMQLAQEKESTAEATGAAFALLQAALAIGTHIAQYGNDAPLALTTAEYALVLAYRVASVARKADFHDLVVAQTEKKRD
jgi:transcriptional regulator with XRE-family HTH domain